MSYTDYKYLTKKQCNILYACFKSGKLATPCDGRGKPKKPGFVYDFEGVAMLRGSLSKEERLLNCQLVALYTALDCVFKDDYTKAQAILNGEDEGFNLVWLPKDVNPKRYWKRVY